MPHLTLEYTNNLTAFDARQVLRACNQALAATGHFDEADIKSRALSLDTYLVGIATEERAFIHARLAILSGRPPEIKSQLSGALLPLLHTACKDIRNCKLQLSVEVIDLDRASYAKEASCRN